MTRDEAQKAFQELVAKCGPGPICPRCGRCVLVGRCCPEPDNLAWRPNGLPWRLAVLDEAAHIALDFSRRAQAAVAVLPRGTAARHKASRLARERHVTVLTLRAAREILAPGRYFDASQVELRRQALLERARMQTTPALRLGFLAECHPWTSRVGQALRAMAGVEHERLNRTASAASEGT